MKRLAIFAALGLVGAPAHAGPTQPRQPTGPWVDEFTRDTCQVSRAYGTPKQPLTLVFGAAPMDDEFNVIVLHSSKLIGPQDGKALLRFDGVDVGVRYSSFRIAVSPKSGWEVDTVRRVGINMGAAAPTAVAMTKVISIEVPHELDANLAIPEIGKAIDDLRSCTIRVGERWGFPAEEQARMAVPPRAVTPLNKLFHEGIYPLAAIEDHALGRVKVRLAIDEAGVATKCEVLLSASHPDLDKQTCALLLKKAKFEPARDAGGRPMRALLTETIYWLLA